MSFLGFHSVAEFTTYATFVLLGMSIMMVVSAITSAPSFVSKYYQFATGDGDAVAENEAFWTNANTFYNVATYIAQLIFEPLALLPFVRMIPLRIRLIVGLVVPLLELLLLIIIPTITIPDQSGAIAVLMVVGVLGGFSKALCNSCTNALVGPFPTKFMNGAMWGLSISALFMSVLQIILQSAMGESFEAQLTQSRIYLGVAIGIQALSVFMFLILYRNPFACHFTAEFRMMNKSGTVTTADGDVVEPVEEEAEEKQSVTSKNGVKVEAGAVMHLKGDADHMVDEDQVANITSSQQMFKANLWPVVKKVYPMLLCTFFIFFVTLFIFPGVFFNAVSFDGWSMTMIVLLFNVGDFASRIILMFRALRPSPIVVVVGTLGRLLVIPLLVLCVRDIITGVWMPYILILIHGLTNGYFGAMSMIHCPRTPALSTAGERSLAAVLSGVFLMLGLCIGSNLAVPLNLKI